MPWAIRYGEPITSMDCWSITQPPLLKKLSVSTSTHSLSLEIPVMEMKKMRIVINNIFSFGLFIMLIFNSDDFLQSLVVNKITNYNTISRRLSSIGIIESFNLIGGISPDFDFIFTWINSISFHSRSMVYPPLA